LPSIDSFAISTGIPIPNLDAFDLGLILVLIVVGGIGVGSMIKSYLDLKELARSNSRRA